MEENKSTNIGDGRKTWQYVFEKLVKHQERWLTGAASSELLTFVLFICFSFNYMLGR